jgi:hypothetical protein
MFLKIYFFGSLSCARFFAISGFVLFRDVSIKSAAISASNSVVLEVGYKWELKISGRVL